MKRQLTVLGSVMMTFLTSAQVTDVFTGFIGNPTRLTKNGSNLYVSEQNSGYITQVDVAQWPVVTNQIVMLNSTDIASMVLIDNTLYFADFSGSRIVKKDISNSASPTVDVLTGISSPNGLVQYQNYLYVSHSVSGIISRFDLNASSPVLENVVSGLGYPACMVVQGTDLYVSEIGGNRISKFSLTSPTPSLVTVTTGVVGPIGIQIVDHVMYIASYLQNCIYQLNLLSIPASPQMFISGIDAPTDIIFMGNDLYFTQNHIKKLSKVANVLDIQQSDARVPVLRAFPNPTTDDFVLDQVPENTPYILYNIHGQKLKSGLVPQDLRISMLAFASGTYFIQINGNQVVKVVKD